MLQEKVLRWELFVNLVKSKVDNAVLIYNKTPHPGRNTYHELTGRSNAIFLQCKLAIINEIDDETSRP